MLPDLRPLAAVAVGTLLFAGCASAPTEPPLTAEHPASPDAPDAPLPGRSRTLAVDESPPLPALEPTPAMLHGPASSGMSGMPGMHHHSADTPGMKHEEPPTQPGENAALSAPRWTPATGPATSPAGNAAREPGLEGQTGEPGHAGHGGHP
jgi:hypothetical protein